MEVNSRDNEVINLLTKLKNANGTYPQELLAMRRQGYLKQVAEVSAGAGLALALKSTIKSGNGVGGGTPAASALLETLLVVAIVAEASTVAYFYRAKLAEVYRSFSNSPQVVEISNPAVSESPIPTFELTPSPVVNVTMTVTETETPTGTPSLELAAEATTTGGDGDDGSQGQTLATPNPSDNTNDNNGNQYGLTPKPERTKDPATNDAKDSDNNNNKPDPNKTK